MSLPPLKVKIGADTIDLDRSIEDVQRKLGGLQASTDRIGRGMQDFGRSAQRLGTRMTVVSAGVAAVGGGMFAMAKSTADAGDEIAKSARAANTAIEDYQELRFAMGQVAGMSDGEFANSLQYLNRQMGEALGGNERAEEALASIGVSLDDISSGAVSAGDVMQAFADNAGQFETGAEAAQAAAVLFGRSGADLGPILRETGGDVSELRDRAQELGIILGQDTLDASEGFVDKMDELSRQVEDAKNAIGQALLPAALGLAVAFQEKVIPAISQVADSIAGVIEWFGNLPGPVQEAAGLVAAALGVGGPIVLAVGVLSSVIGKLLLATGPIGLLIGFAALVYAAWQKWGDDIKRLLGNVSGYFRDNFGGIIKAGTVLFDGITAQAQNFADLLKGIFQGDVKAVADSLFSIFAQPLQSLSALWGALGEDIMDAVGGALDWAKDKFNSFLDFVADIPGKFRDIGRAIMDGLRQGINEAWEAVKASIQEKVDWLPDWVKDRLGIASPSKVFSEIGHNIGDGLAEGVNASQSSVNKAALGLADGAHRSAMQSFSGSFDGINLGSISGPEIRGGTDFDEMLPTLPDGNGFYQSGLSVGASFSEGIEASAPLVHDAVRAMTGSLIGDDDGQAAPGNSGGESGTDGIGEESPMHNLVARFRDFGIGTGESFADGLMSTMDLIRSAVVDIGGEVTDGANNMASSVVDAMADMFRGSKPIAAAQALINTFQGITEALKLPYPESIRAAADVASRGFAAVQGIRSASPSGGGGGGRSGGGGRGGAAQAEAAPAQRIRFEVVGGGVAGDAAFQALELVQEALDNGGQLQGLTVERVT